MTDPIQRHRITTRYDAHTWAVSGVSADLEQQRRERTWRDRMPTAADVKQAVVMSAPAVVVIAVMTGIAWFVNWALAHAVVP